jgi:hypothetical protein
MPVPGLGTGFQAYVDAHKVTARCLFTDTKIDNGWVIAAFDNGLILVWDGHNVLDNQAPQVIGYLLAEVASLNGEVAQLKQHQGVTLPSELQGVLADISNILAPSAHSFAEIAALQKKLGY